MNRRSFLLLALAACGRHAERSDRHTRARPRDDADVVEPIGDDWSHANNTQQLPSPLLVRGEQLVYRLPTELAFFDGKTLAKVGAVAVAYKSACLLRDGRVAAFVNVDGRCAIEIIEGMEVSASLRVAECLPSDGARLFAGAAGEVLISRGREQLVRYRIDGDQLAKLDDVALPAPAEADQIVSLDDGRLVVPAPGSLTVIGGSVHKVSGAIAHLVRGDSESLWFTTWKRDVGVEQLMLGRARDGSVKVVASHSVAPARIIHIASGRTGALAMLTVTVGEDSRTWHLHLFEPGGHRRWQVAIDEEIATKANLDLNAAFVAMTADRVVLALERHGLFAWDAATGARS